MWRPAPPSPPLSPARLIRIWLISLKSEKIRPDPCMVPLPPECAKACLWFLCSSLISRRVHKSVFRILTKAIMPLQTCCNRCAYTVSCKLATGYAATASQAKDQCRVRAERMTRLRLSCHKCFPSAGSCLVVCVCVRYGYVHLY